MSSIDDFKGFVKKNPNLIKHVNNGSMTWQKFYEMYNLYGEEKDAWKDYIGVATIAGTGLGIGEIFNYFKGINLDSIQNGVNSIQRVLGVLTDIKGNDKEASVKEEYKPRPVYKHFDD